MKCVQNIHSTVVGRGGGVNVYVVCRIIFLVFNILHIQKDVQVRSKIKYHKPASCNNVKTHNILLKIMF